MDEENLVQLVKQNEVQDLVPTGKEDPVHRPVHQHHQHLPISRHPVVIQDRGEGRKHHQLNQENTHHHHHHQPVDLRRKEPELEREVKVQAFV